MEKIACTTCQKLKANLSCGICHCSICKSCTQFLDRDFFSFQPDTAEELKSGTFCGDCFENKVRPEIEKYEKDMELAKDIIVYEKKQSKESRLFKRLEPPVTVTQCEDREETLLRLGFLAVQRGFNAIIDVDIRSEKVRMGSYQTMVFTGTAIPSYVDLSRIIKDRSTWSNPN
jgi:hypothetical protein